MSDEPFPGWIEVTFTDADGHLWNLHDKPTIFGNSVALVREAAFPIAVELDCEILHVEQRSGQELITISTRAPWGVTTDDNRSEFIVFGWQLIDR
ncbi:hypothetical protein [Kribbella sp. NPDC006257]|uniref:hypothetical protein n=1 Tax=Kribbella sp. NPDC006257 TaxID=3156738 RepID=UPI0033A16398